MRLCSGQEVRLRPEPFALRQPLIPVTVIGAIVPFILIAMLPSGAWTDYSIFWQAGRMALDGDAATAYANSTTVFNFPYPPFALFLFTPFSLLPLGPATVAWNLFSVILFCLAARPWLPKGFPPLLAVLTPSALLCLFFGQTGLIFGALWLWAFRGSSVCAAMLAFKPHVAVPAAFTLTDRRRFIEASIALLLLVSLSLAFFGGGAWSAFVGRAMAQAGDLAIIGPTMRTRWLFAGVSPAIAYGYIGWIPFALAAGLLLARNFNVFTAATAAALISPYAFNYDLPVACLGFAIMIFSRWRDLSGWARVAAIVGFLSPVISLAGADLVPPALLFALLGQVLHDKGPAVDVVRHRSGADLSGDLDR